MKQLMILVACWCCYAGGYAQTRQISGDWESKFAGNLTLIFHFTTAPDGQSNGTLDIPEQGVQKLPFKIAILTKDSLCIQLMMPEASFAGKFLSDSVINGNWRQGVSIIPLTFKKGSSYQAAGRPQTPLPPFGYTSEDVEFDNADKTVHFGATFSFPKGGNIKATAILISGSGLQDRDETILNHKPFAVIADHLTKNGYAVLRIDDRGTGKTKGPVENSTTADFAKDVEASMAYLETRKEIAGKKLGLIGHSEGGLIAAMTAAAHPAKIDFIVTLAGTGEKGTKILADQNEAIALKKGAPPEVAAAYRELFYGAASAVTPNTDSSTIYKKAWASYLEWKKQQLPATVAQFGILNDTLARQRLLELLSALRTPWTQYFLITDPAAYLARLQCKVLALNGSEDIQVIARTNLAAIRDAVGKSKVTVFDWKELPGLNHLFQHCKSCTVEEYGKLEETFSPEVLALMTDWLNEHVK